MTDLYDYLTPVSIESPPFEHLNALSGFPHNISVYTENLQPGRLNHYKVAILGVPEGRNSPHPGSQKGPDAVRTELYKLAKVPGKLKIIDLGNLRQGATFNDTIAGLSDLLSFLLEENIFPVLIGGSSSVIPAIDKAMSRRKMPYSLAAIDSRIDYFNEKHEAGAFNYLNSILRNQGGTLEHYINIGYQTYLNDQQVINRFLKKRSELMRIGDVRQSIQFTEPLLRDSDVAVFDISSVRQSDAPGTSVPSPNGFYGEEICLLARYAGISDRMKIFGLFDVNPEFDVRCQTSGLAAQIIWFFLEGFSQKQYETGYLREGNPGRFIKYHVRITGLDDDLVFIKSTLTERWWMEISSEKEDSAKRFVACSHEDYLKANRNELPDRWIRASERVK